VQLQSVVRGKRGRAAAQQAKATQLFWHTLAAVQLQSVVRGKRGRAAAQQVKAKAHQLLRHNLAAVQLQSVVRGKRGRAAAQQAKENQLLRHNLAAVQLQSVVRGKRGRAAAQQAKENRLLLQKSTRGEHAVALQPTPPVAVASPPVAVASPPVAVASPPVVVASAPVAVTSPPVAVASPPVAVASPPVVVASPPVAVVSPPVAVASPPVAVTSPPVAVALACTTSEAKQEPMRRASHPSDPVPIDPVPTRRASHPADPVPRPRREPKRCGSAAKLKKHKQFQHRKRSRRQLIQPDKCSEAVRELSTEQPTAPPGGKLTAKSLNVAAAVPQSKCFFPPITSSAALLQTAATPLAVQQRPHTQASAKRSTSRTQAFTNRRSSHTGHLSPPQPFLRLQTAQRTKRGFSFSEHDQSCNGLLY